jgi:hypothetical protein
MPVLAGEYTLKFTPPTAHAVAPSGNGTPGWTVVGVRLMARLLV